jgi:cytochrome b involved in lipid metabolism
MDSNAHSEGRIAKAPKITIGVLDTDAIATDQTSASASELSMNMSVNSMSFSELATKDAPMISLESVEETKQPTTTTSISQGDGPGLGLIPPMSKQMKMGLPTISIEELSKHDTQDDLWTAIDGLVYDITSYAPYHPGGRKIMQGKGKDATAVFRKSSLLPTNTVVAYSL